jgi:hypothetical protein
MSCFPMSYLLSDVRFACPTAKQQPQFIKTQLATEFANNVMDKVELARACPAEWGRPALVSNKRALSKNFSIMLTKLNF